MSRRKWNEWKETEPAYEGVREAEYNLIGIFDWETQVKFGKIIEAMEWTRLLIFEYGGTSRIVAPFVAGMSSEWKALMRGYQLEGVSASGKGGGWRVFQVGKMVNVASHQEFFKPEEYDFDRYLPWIYWTFKLL